MTTSTILSDNGVASGTTGIKTSGGNDGTLVLQTTTSAGAATTAQTIGTDQVTTFAQAANLPNTFGFKNRFINGNMVIAQRGTTSLSVTSGVQYPVDRWLAAGQAADGVFTVQQSSTAPTGFNNSIIATVTTADASIGATQYYTFGQRIEGYNFADLLFGTANAKTFTVSFWVRSSLTGSFGVSFENEDENRRYGALYTISSANTWEYKTITVPGDTTGTWVTTTGRGMTMWFSLGAGSTYSATPSGAWESGVGLGVTGQTQIISTNGATLYVAGAQLEVGKAATSFDYRPYSTELQLCQRYYEVFFTYQYGMLAICQVSGSGSGYAVFPCRVQKRTTPTFSITGTAPYPLNSVGSLGGAATFSLDQGSYDVQRIGFTGSSGLTAGNSTALYANSTAVSFNFSAEL